MQLLKIILRLLLAVLGAAGLLLAGFFLFTNRANGKIRVGGKTRRYILHLPAGYRPGSPLPLVISIHGFADWPAHQMNMSRWNDLADREGFVVVYPMGTGFPRRWNIRSRAEAQADLAFLRALIARLQAQYPLDARRIYVNGLSNGGGMSVAAACEMPGQLAAVGSVAGALLYPTQDCTPARPVPLIAFHGSADPIVPYHGGPAHSSPDLVFPDLPAWVAAWAQRNGCTGAPQPLPAQGAVSGLRYSGPQAGCEVLFYTVAGGGHTWPGGLPMPRFITGHTSPDADATALMWRFFQQHPLN